MSRGRPIAMAVALSLALILSLAGQCYGQLKQGFYNGKCKGTSDDPLGNFLGGRTSTDQFVDVEASMAKLVQEAMEKGEIDAAALLRMLFHDCFVKGCDASILVDGKSSEKTAGPNQSVRGYGFIDNVKNFFEKKCRGVVSCADIIVMATKEAVFLASGKRVNYSVRTGRRDGTVSLASNVNLPSPTITVADSIKAFANKNLSSVEMAYLIGAHTIGITHCNFVKDRLYNFNNVNGASDPNMEPNLREELKRKCPRSPSSDGIPVDLDQGVPKNFIDDKYFGQLTSKRGILQIDQDLATHKPTNVTVERISKGLEDFASEFGKAMVKLGEVEVLTGLQGQIRRSCRFVN